MLTIPTMDINNMEIIYLNIFRADKKTSAQDLKEKDTTTVLIAWVEARGYVASIKADGEAGQEKDFTTIDEAVEYVQEKGYTL